MKADLYTAHARTTGSTGLAHRTAAGFVVLTSADGDDIIALIDAKQSEADLIDQVVAAAQTNGPEAFAMLFTAGGDLYTIAAGAAAVTIESTSMHATIRATPGHVLVQQVGAGLNEADAIVRLHVDNVTGNARTTLDLQAGTVEADWLEVAVGNAVIAADEAINATGATGEPGEASSIDDAEVLAAPVEAPAPQVAAAEISAVVDAPATDVPEPPVPAPAPAEPEIEPEIEPVAILPPTNPAPSAAEDIPFAASAPAPAAATSSPGRVGAAMVLGVACSQGHHNHPDAVYCSQCGTKMGVHHTTVLINGPRPPLGVLVVDDGTTYSLNEDLVIGREPTSHEDVVAGTASPMILTDDTLSLSRKHARIVLDDWSVAVQDLNSSNGTFLSRSGQAEAWTQVEPWSTNTLEPGDRLRVGGRIIQVELHHVR